MSKIVVVGATGLVGSTILQILEERDFPVEELKLLASPASSGKTIDFKGKTYEVKALAASEFEGFDIALFAAGSSVSQEFAPIAAKAGLRVVDNSSFFRMFEEVPLVVPEVNAGVIKESDRIIANPNCSTIQCMPALAAIDKAYGLKRVVFSSYQAVSGSGMKGLAALDGQDNGCYAHPIQNNVLPHIDSFLDTGYTKEEMKMIEESQKILGHRFGVTATTARIPVRYAHSVSANVEVDKPFDLGELAQRLAEAAGVVLMDDPENNVYPTPLFAQGKDETYVGRLRRDTSVPNGLNLWIVSDNVRKGAALNAVQIAEYLERTFG